MAIPQRRSQRVSIVGWGSVSPLGCDASSSWDAVLAARSGIRALTESWSDDLPVRLGGCVPDAATQSLEPLLLRRSDRCAQLGLLAAREAWAMAGDAIAGIDPARVAVVLGTGIGGLHTMHEQHNHNQGWQPPNDDASAQGPLGGAAYQTWPPKRRPLEVKCPRTHGPRRAGRSSCCGKCSCVSVLPELLFWMCWLPGMRRLCGADAG